MSARLPFVFSCIGHAYIHLFTAFYFTIVLALEDAWTLPYHVLIEYWTLGALLVGVAALPAGWLADRWGGPPMMALYFIGMGGGAIVAGLSDGPAALVIGLSSIGLFAAIYHPVGIAWLIRTNTVSAGKRLALNGIFGSVGIGLASVIAGGLIDIGGWRAAFFVPGGISVLTGLVVTVYIRRGAFTDHTVAHPAVAKPSREDRVRVFLILMLTMAMAGVVFQATQTVMPKSPNGSTRGSATARSASA